MNALAIEGGVPVRSTLLPYGRQTIDSADIEAVVRALKSDWLTTGPRVGSFERAFGAMTGAAHAVSVSNGTAALHAAVFAAGIAPGDEVIVPALTFVASANCVRYVGGTVVFADVREDTLNVSPQAVASAITPRTKAIVAVDYAGQPADLHELRELAGHHGVTLIEDASHSLGATVGGQPVGSVADLTTFSLHPVKHITSGEGGLVTTDDRGMADRLRRFRTHGITTDHRWREAQGTWFYEMVDLGYNYRLTDFQCALAESQLGHLPQWVARRREIADRYMSAFAAMDAIERPYVAPGREPSWHLFVIRLSLEALRVDRATVFQALRAENIGVQVHYIPVPWHPYYQELGYSRGGWPVAERAYERILSLPIFPSMTDGDVQDVINACAKVLEAYAA